MTGKLFIISAPSGTGKTSLARALIANVSNAMMSVSHTTRHKRAGEVDGVDYFFVDKTVFFEMVSDDIFLEHAQVYGNCYGTSKLAVQKMLSDGKNVLLDIDWQGARKVREQMPEAVSISILPPSIEELERRLRCRGSDTEDVIRSRMSQAMDEMRHCQEADFIIINDEFNAALDDLTMILDGQSDSIRALNINLDDLLRERS